MSLFNELPTAFPWYEKIEQQYRYLEHTEIDCDYKLITPRNALLPFQFYKAPGANPTTWEIFEVNTNALIVNLSIIGKIRRATRGGKDYIYYDGSALVSLTNVPLVMPFGFYYSRLSFPDGSTFFSEMFYIPEPAIAFNVGAISIPFLKLEWWNNSDIAPIFYNDLVSGKPYFRNVVYLDTFINSSEVEIIEDGEQDGNDELIPTSQKAIIRHRISDFMPDYLKKAVIISQIHDHILVTTKRNVRSGELEKIEVTATLEDDSVFSTVDILFQDTLAIVKRGCADNMV